MSKILVINPGSTSTKVALFEDTQPAWQETIEHASSELQRFVQVSEQLDWRSSLISRLLEEKRLAPDELAAVVGRGGLLKPVSGGTYIINERMLDDARNGIQGEHAANLGCALAAQIAKTGNVPAYVVDPISVDEFEPLARYSGHPQIERRCLAHALSIHAVARDAAEKLGVDFHQTNFVVAHLGGGISVAAVRHGRIIDVNDASSDGPFSPERTGGLPLQPFIGLCFSGKFSERDIRKQVMGSGGLLAFLGTSSAKEVESQIAAGDQKAHEVYQAMAYQIAKEIGAMSAVLHGGVRAIILTGGLAKSNLLTGWITERVKNVAEVLIFAGEFEMEALAAGALRVLTGEEAAKIYP
ncbi:MAG TPA: butyrate kinase [bacterium]